MSVVVVKVYKKSIVIGSDSFIGFGHDAQLQDKDAKLFEQNGIVCGVTGYARDTQLFKLYCRDRKPARNDEDAMIDFVTEYVKWAKERHNTYTLQSDFIIVYLSRVWLIRHDYYIKEILDYRAMGAGQVAAETALYLGRDVKTAIAIACKLSIYCEKPVNIIKVKTGAEHASMGSKDSIA